MSRPRLTYWQASALKAALLGSLRASRYIAIPSLVKRGMMVRLGGRPGHVFYGITELGKQQIAHFLIEESANRVESSALAEGERWAQDMKDRA